MIQRHGGDIYRNQVNMDFSVNTNPLGIPQSVRDAMQGAITHVGEYPDPENALLTEALASHLLIPKEWLCFEPTDGTMLARAIPQIIDYPGAVYIRLFRKKPEHIFDDVPDFKLGKAITVKVGKDVTLVASGIMVEKALKAAEILKEEGIDAGVLNIHTWKPIDEEAIVNAVKKTGALVTCENHTLQGGLGSAVSEVVVSKCPAPVGMIGVNNTFGEVGKKEYLAEKFHLTVEDIVNKAKETIALKK